VVDLKENNWIENFFNQIDDHLNVPFMAGEMISYAAKMGQKRTVNQCNSVSYDF